MRNTVGGLMIGVMLLSGAALAGVALADDGWKNLGGDAARTALSGQKLIYQGGATQSFSASGDTSYVTDHPQSGSWRIEGDKYCSVWPPSDRWACYRLESSADGKTVRFIADDGSMTEGQVAGN